MSTSGGRHTAAEVAALFLSLLPAAAKSTLADRARLGLHGTPATAFCCWAGLPAVLAVLLCGAAAAAASVGCERCAGLAGAELASLALR